MSTLSEALFKHRRGFRERIRPAFYCAGCDWTAVVVADGRDGNGVTIDDQHRMHLADVLESIVAARVEAALAERDEWREAALRFSQDYHAELDRRIDAETALRSTPTSEPCRWTNGGAPACSETRDERYWCEPCRERREVDRDPAIERMIADPDGYYADARAAARAEVEADEQRKGRRR